MIWMARALRHEPIDDRSKGLQRLGDNRAGVPYFGSLPLLPWKKDHGWWAGGKTKHAGPEDPSSCSECVRDPQ